MKEKAIFQKYIEKRLELISRLERGEIDKNEFLYLTDSLFDDVNHIEPSVLKDRDEALYFYQYFNVKAKASMMEAKKYKKNSSEYKNYLAFAEEYYELKEDVIFKFLKMLEADEFEAYFVRATSTKLKNRLIEIDVHSMDKVILHSMSTKTLRYLRSIGRFDEEIRVSKIDDYINKPY